jgi:hypothetical protein
LPRSRRGCVRTFDKRTDHFLATLVLEIDVDVGGSLRSREMKRSNSTFLRAGSIFGDAEAVTDAEFAAEPRP